MNENIFFVAQSLDNESANYVGKGGLSGTIYLLDASEIDEREHINAMVGYVTSNGEKRSETRDTQLFIAEPEADEQQSLFVLRVMTDRLDNIGRLAPIACYSTIPATVTAEWCNMVWAALEKFAGIIERSVIPSAKEEVLNTLSKKLKKNDTSTNSPISLFDDPSFRRAATVGGFVYVISRAIEHSKKRKIEQ